MSWKIDPSHTEITFTARHMMLSKVRGRFGSYEANLNLDAEHPERSVVELTIDVNSIDTGEPNRDNHLRSADFFDVEHYPKMTFRSTKIERVGPSRYKLTGNLTIRDVTRPITLEVTDEGRGQDPWGNQRWGLSGQGKSSRKDFGLNWNVALETGGWLVGDEITIGFETQLVQQAAQPAAADEQVA